MEHFSHTHAKNGLVTHLEAMADTMFAENQKNPVRVLALVVRLPWASLVLVWPVFIIPEWTISIQEEATQANPLAKH